MSDAAIFIPDSIATLDKLRPRSQPSESGVSPDALVFLRCMGAYQPTQTHGILVNPSL